ncbi:MAG: vWA domain-containing protein [Patescibacteria group bacterium]
MGDIRQILSVLLLCLLLCFPAHAVREIDVPGDVAVATQQSEEKAHDCIVVLLDASGSMDEHMDRKSKESRIDAAKRILTSAITQAPSDTYIGFLVMSGSARYEWMQKLGPFDRGTLLTRVKEIRPSGNTPLGTNMKMAADELLTMREKQHNQGMYTLLVLTDGQANPAEEERKVLAFTPEIRSRGILIHAVGIDMDQTHPLATQADTYQNTDSAQALEKRVKEVFAEVSSAADPKLAEDAFLAIAPLPTDVAAAIVQGLSTSVRGNWPIGEQPKPPKGDASAATTDQPSADQQKSGLTGGQIILIVFGCLVVVGVFAVFIYVQQDHY